MHEYFKDNLWLELAEKSNKSAKLLSQSLIKVPHSKLKYKVEANSVFIYLTKIILAILLSLVVMEEVSFLIILLLYQK